MSRQHLTARYPSVSAAFALIVAAGTAGGAIAIDWDLICCATRLGLSAILLRLSADWVATTILDDLAEACSDLRFAHDVILSSSDKLGMNLG